MNDISSDTAGTRPISVPKDGPWWGTAAHRAFLLEDAARQLRFFQAGIDPKGGFHPLTLDGKPRAGAPRELHNTTRMIHCWSMAAMAGVEGALDVVDHGMKALEAQHRDHGHGGWVWGVTPEGEIVNDTKQAYGHAFVLLAGSSAHMAGHPDGEALINDVRAVIETHFWDDQHMRMREEFTRDWQPLSRYRGMNANMHMTEALLASYQATGSSNDLTRAHAILSFFPGTMAAANDWRLPEHYTESWRPDPNYRGDPMFRPPGATPGHAFEFARLALELRELTGHRDDQLLAWAKGLYGRALEDGLVVPRGGIRYTTDAMSGEPLLDNRYWWPLTEAIGAAAALIRAGEGLQADYLHFWRDAEALFIDSRHGGWINEVGPDGRPDEDVHKGKSDLYHSFQAAILPLLPGKGRREDELAALVELPGLVGRVTLP